MRYINSRFFQIDRYHLYSLFCALIVTAVFSVRWYNCLPFSGYMPLATNTDQLDIFARFLIWAKEPFSFPLGVINGLTFPFEDTSITRGPLPLFALIFKGLSRIYQPFSEFYYFVFAELVLVFFAAFFACRILDIYHIKSVWMKLLGATLVALSFPLLYRSSNYYGVTFLIVYVPLYTAFAYYFIRIHKYPDAKSLLLMTCFLPIAAFFDYYVLFGIFFMFTVSLPLVFINFLINRNRANRKRFYYYLTSFIMGIFLVFCVIFFMGKQGELTTHSKTTFTSRSGNSWGYGGGMGGGFHVADVLTLIIPPKDDVGPSAYLTKLGFPLTTNKLQGGQYEGFTYLGTTTIFIFIYLTVVGLILLIRNRKIYPCRLKMIVSNKLFRPNDIFSLALIMGICTFALFIFSWGYIIHIGGVRLNNIGTPALFLAEFWNKFMFARSIGRLAIPFMLYFNLCCLVLFGKIVIQYMLTASTAKRAMAITAILFLTGSHVFEIRGYLQESKVIFGNEIADVFNKQEAIEIRKILKDKKGLIFANPLRSGDDRWLKTCYSLGFYSRIPISGIYSGIAINQNHRVQTEINMRNAKNGHIRGIIELYGDVAFAAPCKIAEEIFQKSDMPLLSYKFEKKNVTVLVLKNG